MSKTGNKKIENFERKVRDVMRRAGVGSVVAGVSGGADSTALLSALRASGIDVTAVHCNYHLRGEESMRDQRFVEDLCQRYGVVLEVADFDVEKFRKGKGMSVEMACRELRYGLFDEVMRRRGAERVAVAHNSDDNVETLLLNLLRGSGVTGLRGMLPDTGTVVRPLLDSSRKEIEEYLIEKGEKFIVDSTNLESEYKRNFLRNEVLPMLETRWPGLRSTMKTTMTNLRAEESVLKWAEKKLLPESDFLAMEEIFNAPDRFWLIYKFATRFGATRDVSLEIADVFEKRGGNQTIVGKSWKAGDGRLRFTMRGLQYLAKKD